MTAATLAQGDCLEILTMIPDGCIDLVLVDLPYGMTACHWDQVIPFDKMWEQLLRVGTKACAFVFFAQQPFTTDLINSNRKNYKYNWTWLKRKACGFQYSKYQPMRRTEDVCVFYRKQPKYNKQGEPYTEPTTMPTAGKRGETMKAWERYQPPLAGGAAIKARTGSRANPASGTTLGEGRVMSGGVYSYTHKTKTNVIEFAGIFNMNKEDALFRHPTQKPLAILRYLIETYTEPGDTVLDFTMGIGSTGVAATQLGRRFFGIEKDPVYFAEAERRIEVAEACSHEVAVK